MGILTVSEVCEYLLQRDRFAIVTHRRPDGDTLGSACALCRGLRQLGKTAHVLENAEVTPKYIHLLEGLTKKTAEEGDTVVCVDVAADSMLPECFLGLSVDLRIDHHRGDRSFTEQELVIPTAAACGQIIYDVLMGMGAQLDVPMANALYTACATDTGCFRYANTQADTFRVAAACAEVSTDLAQINRELFETNSYARLKIQSWMVENARFLCDGQICICAIPLEVEDAIGVKEDDMDNISGFPRSIDGVKIAATLRQERATGKIKISVRCQPECDASSICAQLGGGGHRGAAGASIMTTMEEAFQRLVQAMPKL